jgi:hypothetical protein
VSSSAQIVTRALKRLGLVEPGETPAAADAEDGLAALNAMLAGWQADGINVSPDVPLPAKHEEGVVAMLAVRLAEDYGRSPGPILLRDAGQGLRRIEADYVSAPLAVFDLALIASPSKVYPIMSTTIDDWAVSTAYALFDRVLADDRHIYECIIAGTSASSGDGPHGTGANIEDGTATWRFTGFDS